MLHKHSLKPGLLNKFQVAERLGIHHQTVLKLTRLGRLECHKLGSRSYRYSEEQITRFLSGASTGRNR
jgi:excisionase family DNA binding protein